jgi:hypothetical protein
MHITNGEKIVFANQGIQWFSFENISIQVHGSPGAGGASAFWCCILKNMRCSRPTPAPASAVGGSARAQHQLLVAASCWWPNRRPSAASASAGPWPWSMLLPLSTGSPCAHRWCLTFTLHGKGGREGTGSVDAEWMAMIWEPEHPEKRDLECVEEDLHGVETVDKQRHRCRCSPLRPARKGERTTMATMLTILSAVPMSSCTASQCAPLAATEGDGAEDRAAEIDLAHWAVNWGGLGGGGPHLEPGRRISASNCSQAWAEEGEWFGGEAGVPPIGAAKQECDTIKLKRTDLTRRRPKLIQNTPCLNTL